MKIQPLKQPDTNACGPTSIQMVTNYLDLPITFREIAKISRYKTEGMTNNDLVKTLRSIGLNAQEFNTVSWESLMSYSSKKENAIIVSWMLNGYIGHFSVVQKVTKDHIYLADPVEGKIIRMQKVMFMRLWFDYDDMWFPEKNTDIQLRWMVVVTK